MRRATIAAAVLAVLVLPGYAVSAIQLTDDFGPGIRTVRWDFRNHALMFREYLQDLLADSALDSCFTDARGAMALVLDLPFGSVSRDVRAGKQRGNTGWYARGTACRRTLIRPYPTGVTALVDVLCWQTTRGFPDLDLVVYDPISTSVPLADGTGASAFQCDWLNPPTGDSDHLPIDHALVRFWRVAPEPATLGIWGLLGLASVGVRCWRRRGGQSIERLGGRVTPKRDSRTPWPSHVKVVIQRMIDRHGVK